MKRNAFTLIELLAAIAIVSCLAALSMAGLSKMRGRAASAACQLNMRQIYTGMTEYAADNDGRFPASYDGTPTWPYYTWMYKIAPYVGSAAIDGTGNSNLSLCFRGVMRCPGKEDWQVPGSDLQMTSYSMNTFNPYSGEGTSIKVINIATPTKTMLLTDTKSGNISSATSDWVYGGVGAALRHQNFDNMLFCDGHVGMVPNNGLNFFLVRQ